MLVSQLCQCLVISCEKLRWAIWLLRDCCSLKNFVDSSLSGVCELQKGPVKKRTIEHAKGCVEAGILQEAQWDEMLKGIATPLRSEQDVD
jgi:hypothetical protein